MAKRVIIVGATGSIGRQSLEVIEALPGEFVVVGLSANRDEEGLLRAAAAHPGARLALSGADPKNACIKLRGNAGLDELIRGTDADIVVNGASGAGGLPPSLASLESGKDLALANKESVVLAWGLLAEAAHLSGRAILPVDSEHAALFRLLSLLKGEEPVELLITASGGAFRDRPIADLERVRPEEAATHPTWSMGRKITIDSATMANKGLEVIEASRFFSMDPDRIRVLIHPQSIVHAMVRTRDGSLYSQMSEPDMRIPIQNALTWPELLSCPFGRLDLAGRSLDFLDPDPARYPLLALAYAALRSGEGATIVYNASDEAAVAAFEKGRIRFTDIAAVVESTLDRAWPSRSGDLGSILELDARAREAADDVVDGICRARGV